MKDRKDTKAQPAHRRRWRAGAVHFYRGLPYSLLEKPPFHPSHPSRPRFFMRLRTQDCAAGRMTMGGAHGVVALALRRHVLNSSPLAL